MNVYNYVQFLQEKLEEYMKRRSHRRDATVLWMVVRTYIIITYIKKSIGQLYLQKKKFLDHKIKILKTEVMAAENSALP